MPRGRPSKFPTLDLELVKRLFISGLTDFEICQILQVSVDTLWEWCHKHPDFSEAIKSWKVAADKRVEQSLYKRACGFSHEEEEIFCNKDGVVTRVKKIKKYPPDTMACMYWLNNRQRLIWKQKPEAEEDGSLINNDLEFKDVPKDADAKHRFAKYINVGQS